MQSASMQAPQPPASSVAESSWIVRFCNAVITWTLWVLAAVVPLFFLPWTIEVSELNKQLIIFVGAAIAGLAWLGKMLAQRKFEYRRSVVNAIVLLYLVVYGVSTWASRSHYMSLVGDFGQEMSGFFTILSFVVLYFVVVNHVRTVKDLKRMLKAVLFGGFFAAVFALLQGLGLFVLPFSFAKTPAFNTVGTVAALGVYMAFLVALASGLILADQNREGRMNKRETLGRVFVILTAVLALLLIAAIDFWPVSVALLVSSALLIAFAFIHAGRLKGLSGVLLPIAALIVGAMLIFFKFPVKLQYPAEVMPSMKASADIVMQTLHEAPLFGSGPGTYIFDYAKHHAPEVNKTAFWNLRFDRGATSFLTLLPTIGLIGTLSWLLVSIFLLVSAARKLLKADDETWHVLIGMFSAWFLLVLAAFLYSSTMALAFLFWLTMALLVVVHRKDFYTVRFERSPRAAMILSFVFILSLVFAISGLFIEGQRYAGEIEYANAIRIDNAGGNIDDVISHLTTATNLNQSDDVYLRNLSLALLTKADKLYSNPVSLTKKKGESDADFKTRQQTAQQDQLRQASTLTADAVNVAKKATDLNPSNVADWSVLGSVYESLMGVTDGADTWAKKSYDTAISLAPSNPELQTELGKVLVFQSDAANQKAQGEKDDKAKKADQDNAKSLLSDASDAFNKAITLKSDYAPAHYNLALVLDRQGKTKEAITKMEGVLALNPKDVGVGFQLAMLYYKDGRKDDAMNLLKQVIKLQPDYSNAHWYLGAMYEDKGDLDNAIAQVQEVLKLNPGNQNVEQKLQQLQQKKSNPQQQANGQLPAPVNQPVQNPNEPGVKQ